MNAQIEVPHNPSDAARLNRLLGLLQKLKWEQGADGKVRPAGPADALNDLGLYMLGHEIDMAIERQKADAAPIIPEGYALVPVEITKAMKEAVRENGGDQAMLYALAAWNDLLPASPKPHLRTEAEVRAEAQSKALNDLAVKVSYLPKLNRHEMQAICRFVECGEDGAEHDVPADMMKRLTAIGLVTALGRKRHEISYLGLVTLHAAKAVWAGLRNEALEEAAKVCDGWIEHHGEGSPINFTPARVFAKDAVNDCADNIRALIEKKPA